MTGRLTGGVASGFFLYQASILLPSHQAAYRRGPIWYTQYRHPDIIKYIEAKQDKDLAD
jgi:hypothetical protein